MFEFGNVEAVVKVDRQVLLKVEGIGEYLPEGSRAAVKEGVDYSGLDDDFPI